MTMQLRAGFMLMAALAMFGMAGCDHYNCSSAPELSGSCTASGSGLGTTGTGTGTTGTGTPTAFVFSGVSGTTGISGFTFSAAATNIYPTLNYTVATAPTSGGGELIVAQGQYLYGAFYGTGLFGQIYGWSIDSTGNLTPISGSPFTLPGWTGNILGSMATNPAGTMLFAADPGAYLGESTVYAMQIGDGGVLTQVTGSPFPIPFAPGGMTTDGHGDYLYVLALASSESPVEIGAYNISGSGAPTAVAGSPFVYPMSEVVGDSSGQYLIGTTGGTNGTDDHLYVFGIQQTGSNAGAISPVLGSPFTTVYSPYSFALQSNSGGALLYSFSLLTDGTFNPIEGYELNPSTGALTPVSGSPFLTFLGSNGEFDQSGNYLFVTNATTLTAYQVPSTGELTGEGSIVEGFGSIAITDVP
jgi:6-phosphogluconolactonase